MSFVPTTRHLAEKTPDTLPWRCRWFDHSWKTDRDKTWPDRIRTPGMIRYDECERCHSRRAVCWLFNDDPPPVDFDWIADVPPFLDLELIRHRQEIESRIQRKRRPPTMGYDIPADHHQSLPRKDELTASNGQGCVRGEHIPSPGDEAGKPVVQFEPYTEIIYSRLTFDALNNAARARLPQFRDKHGVLSHSQADGSDWSPSQWLQAVVGELGEYANVRKKFERGDLTFEEYKVMAAKELADVQCYFVLLAQRALDQPGDVHPTGIDLGQATIDKFNEISRRVGSTICLNTDDWRHEASWAKIV